VARLDEERAVRLLERMLAPTGTHPEHVLLGIGDDAAVLTAPGGKLVWTVDVNVAGVHFDLKWLPLLDIGWRSLQAAASDLAAMGARPLGAVSSLILPPGFSSQRLARLAQGQAQAARELGCPIVGGNLSRGGELSVTTSVLGSARRPLLRSGARPNDELWLVGDVGLAAAGLGVLQRAARTRSKAAGRCVRAWRRPSALISAGQQLSGRARAALDVSDGLGKDAARLAAASGVRLVLVESRLRGLLRPELCSVAALLRKDPLWLALEGGEDYALLAAGPRARRPRLARPIGRVERGTGAVLEHEDGRCSPLESLGFDHFRR
jgi:thiamine-monophosphate kinase